MADTELLIDRDRGFRRAAVLRDGRLEGLEIDRDDGRLGTGAVCLGVVDRPLPGLDAAFVRLDRMGTSGWAAGAELRRLQPGALPASGRPVLVQVKTPAEGGKACRLGTEITLPGRFLIHLPAGSGVQVSRRAGGAGRSHGTAKPEELARRAALAGGGAGGWIVRAAAATADPDLVAEEAAALADEGRRLLAAAAATVPPALLAPGPGPARRAVVEWGAAGFTQIPIDDRLAAGDEFQDWCRRCAPDLVAAVRHHRGPPALFDQRGLEERIAALLRPVVPLAGGGSLAIEPTAAVVAIDVNGGERGNPLTVNLEAAGEIARHLRLRNLGGAIVVDFLRLKRPGEVEQLLKSFTAALSLDPSPTQIYGMSRLGLVELTRTRRGLSLAAVIGAEPFSITSEDR